VHVTRELWGPNACNPGSFDSEDDISLIAPLIFNEGDTRW